MATADPNDFEVVANPKDYEVVVTGPHSGAVSTGTPPPNAPVGPEPVAAPVGVVAQSEALGGTPISEMGPQTINPQLAAEQAKFYGTPLIPPKLIEPMVRAGLEATTMGATHLLPRAAQDIISGGVKGLAETEAGFTSPTNLLMVGAGGELGGAANKVVMSGFLTQAAIALPNEYKQFQAATDLGEKARIATQMAASLGIPLGVLAHGTLFGKESAASKPTEAPNEIQKPSTGEDVQRQPEPHGGDGGQRVGVEQSQQEIEVAQAGQNAEPAPNEVAAAAPDSAAAAAVPEVAPQVPARAVSEPQTEPTGIRNSVVDQQRATKGLPPREEPLRQTNPEAWDNMIATVDQNPEAGKQLVAELAVKTRPLAPEESALLAHETVTRENTFDNAIDEVNNAKTPEELVNAKIKLAAARDGVQELYDVGQKAGTESGQSLQARKLMVTKDYSLSRMEAEKRAANDGKPLSDSQLAEVKAAHYQIEELKAKLAAHENVMSQEAQMQAYRGIIKESLNNAKESAKAGRSLIFTLDEAADKARQRIIDRRGRLQITIDPLNVAGLVDEAIIGASHIAHGLDTFATWSTQMVKDFGDRIVPHLQKLWESARQYHDANSRLFGGGQEASNLKRYKTYIENRTNDLLNKMAIGDFTRAKRNQTVLDNEAMRLKARFQEVKNQFETGLTKDQMAKRPVWQKALEQVSGAARASALSGYHTLAKLGSYDIAKLVETPVTEVAGAGLAKVPGLRGIASKANLEAGGNTIQSIGKFYAGVAGKGMQEAGRVLKTNTTEAKLLYGKPDYRAPRWYDFFGNLHQAMKAPLLTGTQEMYRARAYENAIREGLNPNDEFTKAAINKAVYDHSQKSILQENNMFASGVNSLHARMEAKNPKTGQVDIVNATISTLVKTFLTKGIVRTPANYFKQTIARTPIGLATGLVKAGMANYRGIGNLHPIEANATMALLKTGAVGSAFFVLGAIDATKKKEDRAFGGYWEPGRKRDDGDVEWGKIRVGGKQLPHIMTHNPLTESAQMGSTMMRVALSKLRKGDEDTQGMAAGITKAVIGLAGKAPIASPVMRLGQDRSNVAGDLLQGLVPQLIQNIADDTDTKQRSPRSTTDELKAAIPGLRQTVPEKALKPTKSAPTTVSKYRPYKPKH